MEITGYNLNDSADCAEVLALNDRFIRRYTGLCGKFGMLPGFNEIVLEHARDEFPPHYVEYLENLGGFSCLAPPGDPSPELLQEEMPPAGDNPSLPGEDEYTDMPAAPPEIPMPPASQEVDENAPLLQRLENSGRVIITAATQLMMDWTNIFSVGLDSRTGEAGLQILVLIGHFTGVVNSGMYSVMDFRPQMTVALAQQGIADLRHALKLMDGVRKAIPPLDDLFQGRMAATQDLEKMLRRHISLCEMMIEQTDSY